MASVEFRAIQFRLIQGLTASAVFTCALGVSRFWSADHWNPAKTYGCSACEVDMNPMTVAIECPCQAMLSVLGYCRTKIFRSSCGISDLFERAFERLHLPFILMSFSEMFCCDAEQSRSQLTDLVPVLTKIVDSAVAKPADNNLRMEALPAACVLLDAYSGSAHTDPKQQPFWNSVFDSKKQLFTSEKFLQSCGDEGESKLLSTVQQGNVPSDLCSIVLCCRVEIASLISGATLSSFLRLYETRRTEVSVPTFLLCY